MHSRDDSSIERATRASISYPEYTADVVLTHRMAVRRMRGITNETAALNLPEALDRTSYEQHSREFGLSPASDHALTNEVWAQLPSAPAHGVEQTLAKARIEGMRRESSSRPVKPSGQLWEPCPRCGKEPIYMPKHVCLDCWGE